MDKSDVKIWHTACEECGCAVEIPLKDGGNIAWITPICSDCKERLNDEQHN